MKHGPLIFLAALTVISGSWCGLVLAPQAQLGFLGRTNALGGAEQYPLAPPGLAAQGREIYRANGCLYCHSQQVGQDGTHCEIVLTEAGTNAAATAAAIARVNPEISEAAARSLLASLPRTIMRVAGADAAMPVLKEFEKAGGKAQVEIVPFGPDIARGWGQRRTVAQDYLYDDPVQLGSRRVGPDLANVGLRLPDASWHYRHLYNPQAVIQGSVMPPYRFLFETRKIGRAASPEALAFSGELGPPAGDEIVPTPEARALVAYLLSLRADAPLFEAPYTPPPAKAAVPTNSAAASPK